MITRRKSYLGRNLLALTFLFVFFAGSFGLATVWLRQQIAIAGSETRAMEQRLADVERFDAKLTGEIALAMGPFFLEQQNARFALGLRQPQEKQVVRVDARTQERFARFRSDQMVSLPDQPRFTLNEGRN